MIARFFRGMGYFGRGWRVAFGSLRVLPFVLLPAALTFTVASLGALLALRKGFALVEGLFGKHGDVVGALVHVLVWIVVVAAFFLFYVAASFVATAPFAGFISERTEAVHTGQPVPPQSLARALFLSLRGLGQALLGVALYLAIALPLFVAHWAVPLLAPLFWALGVVQTAMFFAFDAFYEPLHRQGASWGAKWRFVGAHFAESLGFGTLVTMLMVVPFLSVLVTPVAIVGGTLLYLDLVARDKMTA